MTEFSFLGELLH